MSNGTITLNGTTYDVVLTPHAVTPVAPTATPQLPKLMMTAAWPLNQPATSFSDETRSLKSSTDGSFTPKPITDVFLSLHGAYGIHFDNTMRVTVVDTRQTPNIFAPVKMTTDYTSALYNSSHVPVIGGKIEGTNGSDPSSDRHVLIYDAATSILHELYNVHLNADGSYDAAAYIPWDTTKPMVLPNGQTSCDAAGLPILPLLLRWAEANSGSINHALRVTINTTRANGNGGAFSAPASHAAGNNWSEVAYMGMRLRMRPDFPTDGLPPIQVTIINCLKTYGLVVADNGATGYMTTDNDSRWDMDAMTAFGSSIKLSDFIPVNSAPIIDSNGAEVQ